MNSSVGKPAELKPSIAKLLDLASAVLEEHNHSAKRAISEDRGSDTEKAPSPTNKRARNRLSGTPEVVGLSDRMEPAVLRPTRVDISEKQIDDVRPPAKVSSVKELAHSRKVRVPRIEDLRNAGYLDSAEASREAWDWARAHDPNEEVWPTPINGVQEGVVFNQSGWPDDSTTASEWVGMLTFWTALRMQLVGGAPRRARNSVSKLFSTYA